MLRSFLCGAPKVGDVYEFDEEGCSQMTAMVIHVVREWLVRKVVYMRFSDGINLRSTAVMPLTAFHYCYKKRGAE